MADGFLRGTEEFQARDQALEFLHELGWLLHRSHLKFRVGSGANLNPFPFQRFKQLIDFSIDHDWCAVVKKLLDVFFNGVVDVGPQSSLDVPLREVGILHRAVRRKCRSMVDVLLKYRHHGAFDKSGLQKQQDDHGYLFRPDAVGPGGLTPLHVVASLAGFENLLDALIDDPGQVYFSFFIMCILVFCIENRQSPQSTKRGCGWGGTVRHDKISNSLHSFPCYQG